MKNLFNLLYKRPIIVIISVSLAILGLFLFYELKITNRHMGAPLDDVYIHFQFSKNLARYHEFSFNVDQPTPGSTSPLWTLLLTCPYLFITKHLLIAKLLSAFFYILTGIISYFLGYKLAGSKKDAILIALLTLSVGRLAWTGLSGMEVTLFAFVFNLFVYLHIKGKHKWLPVLALAVASTIRPEAYLFAVFYFFLKIAEIIASSKNSLSKLLKLSPQLIISVLIYICIVAPYLIFSYKTTGYLLPNTFRAQSIISDSLLFKAKGAIIYLARFGYLIFIDNPIIAMGIPLGLAGLISKAIKQQKYLFILFALIGFPIVASITAPNLRHHGRYIIPLIPLYTIVGFIGMKTLLHKHINISKRTIKTKMLLMLASVYLFCMLLTWASTFGWNVKNINDMHVHLGHWIRANTPNESVIALNDIGAITYISQREIIDMVGLVSPEVLEITEGLSKKEKQEKLWTYLMKKKPDYVIILPSWYPEITKQENLEEVYRVQLDNYTIIDGEMIVYKLNSQ